MSDIPAEDSSWQKIPVPGQLRKESFIKLNSERSMLHPTEEAVNKWNEIHMHAPETLTTFSAALKKPVGPWKDEMYRYTADRIDRYRMLSPGFGNYGIIPTTLAVMDIDNVELMEKEYQILSSLPETYRIRSGRISPAGTHVYLRITDIPKDHPFYRNKIVFAGDRGDIRFPGHFSYVVGPYSMHPSGRRYLPVSGLETTPVATIGFDDFLELIRPVPVKDTTNNVTTLREKISHGKKRTDTGNVWYQMVDLYNADHPVLDKLTGYQRIGDRLKSPESSPSTGPGVVVICHNGAEKVLNYHTDDTYLNQGDGRIPTSSYDLLIKDEGREEARKILLDFIKKFYPDVYSSYRKECRTSQNTRKSLMAFRFAASVPPNPVTGKRVL